MKKNVVKLLGWSWLVFVSASCGSSEVPITIHTIEVKGMKFQPALLTVSSGDSVVWINRDIVAHDIMEETTEVWASSKLTSGKSWGMIVTKDYDYFCNLHKVMKGKLRVERE